MSDDDVKKAVGDSAFAIAYRAFGQEKYNGAGRHRDKLATKIRRELPGVVEKMKSEVVEELGPARRRRCAKLDIELPFGLSVAARLIGLDRKLSRVDEIMETGGEFNLIASANELGASMYHFQIDVEVGRPVFRCANSTILEPTPLYAIEHMAVVWMFGPKDGVIYGIRLDSGSFMNMTPGRGYSETSSISLSFLDWEELEPAKVRAT